MQHISNYLTKYQKKPEEKTKTFRVHLSEVQTFYCDVEARSEEEARDIVDTAISGFAGEQDVGLEDLDIQEDNSGYKGYEIDAVEDYSINKDIPL